MCYLYVTEHGCVIGCEQNRFEVRKHNQVITSIPIETLDSIEIHGKSQMTTQAIEECLCRDIPVSFHSGMGKYIGKLSSSGVTNVYRQKMQVRRSDDIEFTLSFAKRIIKAKMNNQLVILRRYTRNNEKNIHVQMKNIKYVRRKIENCKSIEEIMGYEGYAARNYFSALENLVDEEFAFSGRSRRPPKDEFNALLSLGYSILTHEICAKIEKKGLNAYFGIMHSDKSGHAALASDLIEEWRPVIVDSLVLALINGHEIKKEHFIKKPDKESTYLTNEGKRIFIEKMEKRLQREIEYLEYLAYPVSFRQALDHQIEQFCKCLETGNVNDYYPVKIR